MCIYLSPYLLPKAVRIIRKKLAHKHIRVVLFAVTLTEALVKNCGFELHQAIATPSVSQLHCEFFFFFFFFFASVVLNYGCEKRCASNMCQRSELSCFHL